MPKNLPILILLLQTSAGLFAQSVISGTVLDASSTMPLTGATVVISETGQGTITDDNGFFSFDKKGNQPPVVRISFIGYETREITLEKGKPAKIYLAPASSSLDEVIVTARRRNEEVQQISIPASVLGARIIDQTASFNVNRVKELVPFIQLYSSNQRNTTMNIRGLGSTFGLTNDGIDPGVGFYVDGIYYSRLAATTIDFLDIQQVEVLRGPQGTLFGKNTTAGALNITTKKPTFYTTGTFEQTFGNLGFIQTKGSFSGPLVSDKLAVRFAFTGTYRDGTLYNVRTEKYVNTMNNQGFRTQFLYVASDKTMVTLSGDYNRQRPEGFAQVFAGVAPTQRPGFMQFDSIIADLGYELPSRDPFDRIIDHDTPWRSNQDMGGVSLTAEHHTGKGSLTSSSAWRTWKWDPSNDRDFTGLQALALSGAPSIHHQWSQEIRYAGDFSKKLSGVAGIFTFYQKLDPDGVHVLESGRDEWRFSQNSLSPLWQTEGLLDGYGLRTIPRSRNFSGALFVQVDWECIGRLTILPGIRLNYDHKSVDFKREIYGGLQTSDPTLIALQRKVYSPQEFQADVDDWNVSGQLAVKYKLHNRARIFATWATGFKPVGLNLGGLPTENGRTMTELATIEPERVNHYEISVKTEPTVLSVINLTAFNTMIHDYQTNVQAAELGVTRGYLANAELVRVTGIELEASQTVRDFLKLNGAFCYTDGRYLSFTNAPVPLEETGGESYKDISGEVLPGISKWAFSAGTEWTQPGQLIGQAGEYFFGLNSYYRSTFSSSPSPSRYLNIPGYMLVNARLGFKAPRGITVFLWGRNLADADYFEQLLPAGGNAGHYAGVLGDPRTYGITVSYSYF